MKNKKFLLLALLLCSLAWQQATPQSRGPTPGELYITGMYAIYPDDPFNALIHTNNYGRNFTLKYLYQYGSDNTPIGFILSLIHI